MNVQIWSDINCPFCYIGKRKFEKALAGFDHKDKVDVEWRSFQLDPDLKMIPGKSIHQYLADRKGITLEKAREMNDFMTNNAKEVGLTYNFDTAILNNSLDAHRLLHLAKKHGLQNDTKEALFKAYYTNGLDIGDHHTLTDIGTSVGIPKEEISAMLDSDLFKEEVEADQSMARQVGASGVPFFVFNNKYAVSGAQPTDLFAEVLNKVWQEEVPAIAEGAVCGPDGVCD
ncbi:MAG: DsbA family oxidoreductase [Chitinophagaceae bacterium]